MNAADATTLYHAHLDTLRERYAAALATTGFDAVVIAAGEPAPIFFDDQHLPFKANPYLLQWGPLREHPGSVLIVRAGGAAEWLVHTPEDFWYRIPPVPELIADGPLPVRTVVDTATVVAAISKLSGSVALVGETRPDMGDFGVPAVNPRNLLDELNETRTRKTAWEVHCIREATVTAVAGHLAAEACFAGGGSEYDVHLAFRTACRATDEELPYPAIVAMNEHCATLHYQRLERSNGINNSLLIDAGCAQHGYACDITRSYSENPEFGALVEAMHEVQRAICEAAVAGVDYRDLHKAAHHGIAALLQEAGVLHATPEETVDTGLSRVFFPHGLGHYLGLQVHDVGALYTRRQSGEPVPEGEDRWLRLTRVLEPGNVLTIEPGIYFIDSLLADIREKPEGKLVDWGLIDELRPFGGIRIEDDLHITQDGNENLTRSAFAEHA